MRALTLWNPVVLFRRRCNLCNLGNYGSRDEHDDFWFNKLNTHTDTRSCSCSCTEAEVDVHHHVHVITALLLHVGFSRLHPHISEIWAQTRLLKLLYKMWLLWPERENMMLVLCKVQFAEVVRRLWWYLWLSVLHQSSPAEVGAAVKSARRSVIASTTANDSAVLLQAQSKKVYISDKLISA